MNGKSNDADTDRLWGNGGPYSQIQVNREIRILDDNLSREKYFIYANINPATIEILQKSKAMIRNDSILKVLEESEYSDEKNGYIWEISEGDAYDLEKVNYLAKTATDTITEMHKLVMYFSKNYN